MSSETRSSSSIDLVSGAGQNILSAAELSLLIDNEGYSKMSCVGNRTYLRQSPTGHIVRHMSYDPSDCEFLVDSFGVASMQDYYALYASELERLQRIGSSYGLHTIASQYALYLSSSTESHGITHGYAVTPYFGTSETLDAYIANRASQKTISALGSTLLEYYAPGSETYILDITELCQYSPGVRLYDIDPDVMMRFSDAKWVYDEIRPLVQWHWPVKS